MGKGVVGSWGRLGARCSFWKGLVICTADKFEFFCFNSRAHFHTTCIHYFQRSKELVLAIKLPYFLCFLIQGPQNTLSFSLSGDQTALSYFRLTEAANVAQGRYSTSLTYIRPLYLDNTDAASYSVSRTGCERCS